MLTEPDNPGDDEIPGPTMVTAGTEVNTVDADPNDELVFVEDVGAGVVVPSADPSDALSLPPPPRAPIATPTATATTTARQTTSAAAAIRVRE
jgi:hypothetical protein